MKRWYEVFDMRGFRIGGLWAESDRIALDLAKQQYPLRSGLMVEDVKARERRDYILVMQ